MICSRCQGVGKDLVKSFTNAERLLAISSVIAMLRSIENGRKDVNDLTVANSVLTKFLLSFDENSRGTLVQHFRQGLGLDIKLGSCPHGISIVS